MATGALPSGLHQGRALAVDLDPRPPGLKNEGRHDQGRAQHDGDEDTPKRHDPLLVNPPEPRAVFAESASNTRKPRRSRLAHLGQTRASRARGAERLRCLAGGSARFNKSFATLETQSLEKPNVAHLQRLAKSRVRVHIPQPIAAPEGSEINHGIHRNTRKRESESTSPFHVLPGGGPTPAGWGAPPVGWGRSVVTRL